MVRFMELPAELRTSVYDFAIPSGGIPYYALRDQSDSIQPSDIAEHEKCITTHPYGLVFTNKFISQEFLAHTYANALFTFFVCDTGTCDFYGAWLVASSVLNRITHCAFAADLSRVPSPCGVTATLSLSGSSSCSSVYGQPHDLIIRRPDNLYQTIKVSPAYLIPQLPRLKTLTSLLYLPRWMSDDENDLHCQPEAKKEPICIEGRIPIEHYEADCKSLWWTLLHG